jgi:hypothetical protein
VAECIANGLGTVTDVTGGPWESHRPRSKVNA